MSSAKIEAHTTYSDLKGTASIDGEAGIELHSLAQKFGIDTQAWFPVGISLSLLEGYDFVYIYAVKGATTYDQLMAIKAEHLDALPVTRFLLRDFTVADYLKLIKRFNVEVKTKGVQDVVQFELSEGPEEGCCQV